MSVLYGTRVGDVRPSQLMWSYGVGAIVDLPRLSVMVEGLELWATENCRVISEERLRAAVRAELGQQVERLLEPPLPEEDPFSAAWDDPVHRIGVPVGVFPRWLRCPRCSLLSDADAGVFKFRGNNKKPDDTTYVHDNCPKKRGGKAPGCVPARFVVACIAGHLDDFPWREYVHRGPTTCHGTLRFFEVGSSLETANLFVACDEGLGFPAGGEFDGEVEAGGEGGHSGGCGTRPRSMVDAFGARARGVLPACRGRHPHLREASGDCGRDIRTILLGSSSSWFPKSISALSIPTGATELGQLVESRWAQLTDLEDPREVATLRKVNALGPLTKFSDEEIWDATVTHRAAQVEADHEPAMKPPEWAVLTNPAAAPRSADFWLTEGEVPTGYEQWFMPTVLVEKIREVNALIGFTRLEAPEDLLRGDEHLEYAPISRTPPTWVPATEVRGEGVLVRFRAEAVAAWESQPEVIAQLERLERSNRAWREDRRLDPDFGFPSRRHVLLHTFSHLLMRELALESGYSATSVRERVYASAPGDGDDMCGVLLYTAAPDSEGTLGGLVRLGEAATLGRLIGQAVGHASLCASDPLCAEHDPEPEHSLHLASCHACAFAPETACEFGNRFLDRATVVPTLQLGDVALFS